MYGQSITVAPLIVRLIPLLLPAAVLWSFGWLWWRARQQRKAAQADPNIQVESLTDETLIDDHGAVRSVQSGDVWLPTELLGQVWTPEYLERLARTYWFQLGRMSFRTLRVMYTPNGRAMALFGLIPLITFHQPDYELGDRRASVRWRIKHGLLVSHRGAGSGGYLEIVVERRASDRPGLDHLHVQLTVANFYPAIADRFSRRLYAATQSRIHIFATHSFLRSLSRGQLAPSKVGRFARWPEELAERRQHER